nr:unnamed protein product [Haemonchus contortus]
MNAQSQFYDDREFSEHTNDSVNRAILYYFIFVMFLMTVLVVILYGMKLHYRVRLADELDKIRQDKEPARVYCESKPIFERESAS